MVTLDEVAIMLANSFPCRANQEILKHFLKSIFLRMFFFSQENVPELAAHTCTKRHPDKRQTVINTGTFISLSKTYNFF